MGGADRHQGQLENEKPVVVRRIGIKLDLNQRRFCAVSYTNYSDFKNLSALMPLANGRKLISAYEQVELAHWILDLQGFRESMVKVGPGRCNSGASPHDTLDVA
jgi:hypothetical protein